MYKVVNPSNRFLSYTYEPEEAAYMSEQPLPKLSSIHSNPHDLIIAWSDLARGAFHSAPVESSIECWSGHYQQFGRLMFHLLDVIVRRKEYISSQRFDEAQLDFFQAGYDLYFIASGPSGTEDREFYRCWLSLIGHPDFIFNQCRGVESEANAYHKYVMTALLIDLGKACATKKKGEFIYIPS